MPVFKKWLEQGNEMSYKNADQWADLDDEKIREILASKIDKLAMSMRNYVSLIDPGKVILMGYMFGVDDFYNKFIKAYKEYDDGVSDDLFVKSETSTGKEHIEPLATAMNEWFF